MTIVVAFELLDRESTQAQLGRFILKHQLEAGDAPGMSVGKRINSIIEFVVRNPQLKTAEGDNLTESVIRAIVRECASSHGAFEEHAPDLARALKRDGFEVVDGELRRTLPPELDLPSADDEVHTLLRAFGFIVPLGHLDQAIKNHGEGNWAAANGQLRTYVEALLDEIATKLAAGSAALPATGHSRRTWLASLSPAFLFGDLNEWDGQGKGFLEGFYRRLHPSGSHPGLSDEEDCTFRLHLVLLISRLLLRRLRARLP